MSLAPVVANTALANSIAVFLHTLRFKKIVNPKISFGIYVTMAYMSFLAVPPLLMNLLAR